MQVLRTCSARSIQVNKQNAMKKFLSPSWINNASIVTSIFSVSKMEVKSSWSDMSSTPNQQTTKSN